MLDSSLLTKKIMSSRRHSYKTIEGVAIEKKETISNQSGVPFLLSSVQL